jgi:UDP-2,4-diacetamido-2,4,6-trideoxy-beta-L-altropyranose hydrolase
LTAGSTVAFRVDASPIIGIGHLRRCLTLATVLRQRGCEVRFVGRNPFGPRLEPLLAPYTAKWLGHATDADDHDDAATVERRDAEGTVAVLGPPRTERCWVVVDSYRLGHRWEAAVRRAGYRICAIDDYRNRMHHADLLVSDADTPFDRALNELSAAARCLAGRQYALLDPDYAFVEDHAEPPTGAKRVLVCYGGSDPTGETLKALAAFRAWRDDPSRRDRLGQIDVVAGPANLRAADIHEAAAGIPGAVVHGAMPSLAPLMRAADLVLTAGGNTMIEALALRKPCIVTVTGDNQAMMVARLRDEGLVMSLDEHQRTAPGDVLRVLARVLDEIGSMAARIRRAAPFDHFGAERIVEAMLAPRA